MRKGFVAASLIAVLAASACSKGLPDGWTQNSDGAYEHASSGVVCAKTIGKYTLTKLDDAAPLGLLGTCVYDGGDMRVGEIRVRKFVDGQGDSQIEIQNDRGLISGKAPPGKKGMFAFSTGPGPAIGDRQTEENEITAVSHGLLVDCIAYAKPGVDETVYGMANFVKPCLQVFGH
jgi:hypothetical protein